MDFFWGTRQTTWRWLLKKLNPERDEFFINFDINYLDISNMNINMVIDPGIEND